MLKAKIKKNDEVLVTLGAQNALYLLASLFVIGASLAGFS